MEAARRPERERTRLFALSAIGSASSRWMRLSSFGNRSETRRRDRTSWAIPSTRTPVASAIAGLLLRRRRSVLDGAVGGGLDRPLPLAIGGSVDRKRVDVAFTLDQSAIGGLAGFADLQREVDRVVAVEQGEQGSDLLGGDMAGGGKRAGPLAGDAPPPFRTKDGLVQGRLVEVEGQDVADGGHVLGVDGDGPQVARNERRQGHELLPFGRRVSVVDTVSGDCDRALVVAQPTRPRRRFQIG